MWERSPTARLIWGTALAVLLVFSGGVAISSGALLWIAAFLLIAAIGLAQLLIAGPTEGRLWDSPLTKLLYAYIALWGLYVFGKGAIETGSAFSIAFLVLLAGLIVLQLVSAAQDRKEA